MPSEPSREAIAARTEARELFWRENDQDGYSCPDCGTEDVRFDVHHIDGDWSNNALDNLIGLCYPCHKRRHRRESIEARLQGMREELNEITA